MAIKLNWSLEITGLASDVGLVETMKFSKEMKLVSGYRHYEEQALENNKIKSVQHKVQSFENFYLTNV